MYDNEYARFAIYFLLAVMPYVGVRAQEIRWKFNLTRFQKMNKAD